MHASALFNIPCENVPFHPHCIPMCICPYVFVLPSFGGNTLFTVRGHDTASNVSGLIRLERFPSSATRPELKTRPVKAMSYRRPNQRTPVSLYHLGVSNPNAPPISPLIGPTCMGALPLTSANNLYEKRLPASNSPVCVCARVHACLSASDR